MTAGSIPAASTKNLQIPSEETGVAESEGADEGAGPGDGLPTIDPTGRSGVYVIMGVPGWVKIGKAKNIAKRMGHLQVGHPVPLRLVAVMTAGMEYEGLLHARFRHLRSCGEWFRLTDELLRVITGKEHPFAPYLDHERNAQIKREIDERRERNKRYNAARRERKAAEAAAAVEAAARESERLAAEAKEAARASLAAAQQRARDRRRASSRCAKPPTRDDIRAWLAARRPALPAPAEAGR